MYVICSSTCIECIIFYAIQCFSLWNLTTVCHSILYYLSERERLLVKFYIFFLLLHFCSLHSISLIPPHSSRVWVWLMRIFLIDLFTYMRCASCAYVHVSVVILLFRQQIGINNSNNNNRNK